MIIFWSISHYPPPQVLPFLRSQVILLIQVVTSGCTHSPIFFWNNLPLFLLVYGLNHVPWPLLVVPRFLQRPSTARPALLRIFVDCSSTLPSSFPVFSAIRISPAFTHLFGLLRFRPNSRVLQAFNPFNLILAFYFWLWIFTESVLVHSLTPLPHVISDGVRTFQVTPRSYVYAIRDLQGRIRVRRPTLKRCTPLFHSLKRLLGLYLLL